MAMMRPWWETLPETPQEAVVRGLETPSPVPVGGIGATVSKTIVKHVTKGGLRGLLVGGAAGAIGMALLGGGGKQEVAPKQETAVVPTQEPRQTAQQKMTTRMRDILAEHRAALTAAAESKVDVKPTIVPSYDISAGGDVDIGGVSHLTRTITRTEAGISQDVIGQLTAALQQTKQQPYQITLTTPTQETTATQQNMGLIALLAIAGLAGLMFLKGGKKK